MPRASKVHIVLASTWRRELLTAIRSVLPELVPGDKFTVLLCGPSRAPGALLDALQPLLARSGAVIRRSAAPEATPRCYKARSALMTAPGFGTGVDYVLQLPDDGTLERGGLAAAIAGATPAALNLASVTRAGKASLPLPRVPALARGNVDMAQALLAPKLASAAIMPDTATGDFEYFNALQYRARGVNVVRVTLAALAVR